MDGTGRIAPQTKAAADFLAMLWDHYVFGRGEDVRVLWDGLFTEKDVRLLYIAGRGFDVRAEAVMRSFVDGGIACVRKLDAAKLLMIDFGGYELSSELEDLTVSNAKKLSELFSCLGITETVRMGFSAEGEDDISPNNALRIGAKEVIDQVSGYTDVVVDVSTLPRVVYVTLLTGLLSKLVPDKNAAGALSISGVNLHMLVAEDPKLDAVISAEDPSNDVILIPGFAEIMQAESCRDWPMVWFPILGEGRGSQFKKVMDGAIPSFAEICPVLPHPSRDLRRADKLLTEHREALFDTRQIPTSNILYAHEAHPFEAYRQVLGAMERYRRSLEILGGCRLAVTPLGSKLVTLGASLACYEMRPTEQSARYGVAIPYAEPRRYIASAADLAHSRPDICALVLTGEAYA